MPRAPLFSKYFPSKITEKVANFNTENSLNLSMKPPELIICMNIKIEFIILFTFTCYHGKCQFRKLCFIFKRDPKIVLNPSDSSISVDCIIIIVNRVHSCR